MSKNQAVFLTLLVVAPAVVALPFLVPPEDRYPIPFPVQWVVACPGGGPSGCTNEFLIETYFTFMEGESAWLHPDSSFTAVQAGMDGNLPTVLARFEAPHHVDSAEQLRQLALGHMRTLRDLRLDRSSGTSRRPVHDALGLLSASVAAARLGPAADRVLVLGVDADARQGLRPVSDALAEVASEQWADGTRFFDSIDVCTPVVTAPGDDPAGDSTAAPPRAWARGGIRLHSSCSSLFPALPEAVLAEVKEGTAATTAANMVER